MKTNAVVRIVIYSLVILFLLAILCAGLGFGMFAINLGSGTEITGEGSVSAAGITNLEIDWAAGSITILTADTDQITFTESGYAGENQRMVYSQKGNTLKISFSNTITVFGFGTGPSKDLTVTVPESWVCQELEIDGADLDVLIDGLTVNSIELDGAAMELDFNGSVSRLTCDGAACELKVRTAATPESIDVDGAACNMELSLPSDSGFLARMNGLGCYFKSTFDYTVSNRDYLHGDGSCQINVDGLGCNLTILILE